VDTPDISGAMDYVHSRYMVDMPLVMRRLKSDRQKTQILSMLM